MPQINPKQVLESPYIAKKLFFGILSVVAIAVIFLFASNFSGEKKEQQGKQENQEQTPQEQSQVISYEPGVLPDGFDSSLILEEGAEVYNGKITAYKDGSIEKEVTYNSANTPIENLKLFGPYTTENEWVLVSLKDGQDLSSVSLYKEENPNFKLDITFTSNEESGGSVVRIISSFESNNP